jgi:hypothetical protein
MCIKMIINNIEMKKTVWRVKNLAANLCYNN